MPSAGRATSVCSEPMTAPEDRDGPWIEFLTDPAEPSVAAPSAPAGSPDSRSPDSRSPDPRSPDARSADPRSPDPRSADPRSADPGGRRAPRDRQARWRWRSPAVAVPLAAVVLAAGWLAAIGAHGHGRHDAGHPAIATGSPGPGKRTGAAGCPAVCTPADRPTAAMVQLFARHWPGAIPTYEHTDTDRARDGSRVLAYRMVRASYGNVLVTVTIEPAASFADLPGAAEILSHSGFWMAYQFSGVYPPTASQLRALTDDAQLVSPDS